MAQPSFARKKALECKAREKQEKAARKAALHAPQYDLDGQSMPTDIALIVPEVLPVEEVGSWKEHAKPLRPGLPGSGPESSALLKKMLPPSYQAVVSQQAKTGEKISKIPVVNTSAPLRR